MEDETDADAFFTPLCADDFLAGETCAAIYEAVPAATARSRSLDQTSGKPSSAIATKKGKIVMKKGLQKAPKDAKGSTDASPAGSGASSPLTCKRASESVSECVNG